MDNNFTDSEKDLIDFLEKDFLDDIDDYFSAENLINLKATNSQDVRPSFFRFIDTILNTKSEQSVRNDEFNKRYYTALEACKAAALKESTLKSQVNSSQCSEDFGRQIDIQSQNELKLSGMSSKSERKTNRLISKDIFCIVEYHEIDISQLKERIIKFIDTFTGVKLSMPYSNTPSFSLTEEIQVHDEFGEWNYDHFQGCMRITLKMQKGPLPEVFTVDKHFFNRNKDNIIFQDGFEESLMDNQSSSSMDLERFLKHVVDFNQKNPNYVSQWLEWFKKEHIEKLQELLDWDDKDWDEFKLEVNTKKLVRREINKLKHKSNLKSKSELTASERYAIVHRIKRYLVYKTNKEELKDVAYLDEEALKTGFQEIAKEYIGDYLLSQLRNFYSSLTIPRSYSKSLSPSRGMLLFGPPGTGKTTLTETLPNRIGLTQISYPLSAAELNRSLVGQTEKLILDLVARANKIPYLFCCISIDEIDSLAPKRDEKSSQHKTDVLGVLLSVIGGIKDVPNLMFLASTNRLNQIDEAFKRRMSGQFFVGRPSPAARKIMIENSEGTNLDDMMAEQVVVMTSNFSGAAFKALLSNIVDEVWKLNGKPLTYHQVELGLSLSYEQLVTIAVRNSKQFSIRLGNHSIPELFESQKQREKLISISFLRSLKENKGIITFKEKYLEVYYKKTRVTFSNASETLEIEELDKQNIIMKDHCDDFYSLYGSLTKFLDSTIETAYVSLMEINDLKRSDLVIAFIEETIKKFAQNAIENPDRTFLVIWNDIFSVLKGSEMNYMEKEDKAQVKKCFAESFNMINPLNNLYNLYTTSKRNRKRFFKLVDWDTLQSFNKKELKFTGRILIDLNDEDQEMRFQLDEKGQDRYQLHSEPLFLDKKASNSSKVLPKLVEFTSERGIDFILLMDQDFRLSNNAFDESKIMENINEKMQEFTSYEKSLLIIDVDSLVGVVQSVSYSSMGPSTSYNLSDSKLYNVVIHYANSSPKILSESEHWVALISKNKELTKMIKQDLSWPKTIQEIEQQQEEEKLQEEVRCVRCNETFMQAKNELNSCSYHNGMLYEFSAPNYQWRALEVKEANRQFLIKSKIAQRDQLKEPQFRYICCHQPLGSHGCSKHRHTSDQKAWSDEKNKKSREHTEELESLRNY